MNTGVLLLLTLAGGSSLQEHYPLSSSSDLGAASNDCEHDSAQLRPRIAMLGKVIPIRAERHAPFLMDQVCQSSGRNSDNWLALCQLPPDYVREQQRAEALLLRTMQLLEPNPIELAPIPSAVPTISTEDAVADETPEILTARVDRLALLVGIDEYMSPSVSDLRGCVNDVNDMHDLLVRNFGFPESAIHVLTNANATRERIIDSIERHLLDRAEKDALVVFYYSGHGSRAKDEPDGDEDDGWDETIVSHDSRTPGIYDITDDEINGLLTALSNRTRNITFVFDSCHSGTAAKAMGATARRTADDLRDPPPPAEFAGNAQGLAGRENYVLLSGCGPTELSYEMVWDRQVRGAMTYFLTREIRNAENRGVTYEQIMKYVRANVNSVFGAQHPQLEGANAVDLVFKAKSSPTAERIMATPISSFALLDAGAYREIQPGSVFDLYPPSAANSEDPGSPIARVEVTSTKEFSAQAKYLTGGPIDEPAIAIKRSHAFAEDRFPLFFDLDGIIDDDSTGNSETLEQLKLKMSLGQNRLRFRIVDQSSDAKLIIRASTRGTIDLVDGSRVIDSRLEADAPDVESRFEDKVVHWAKWVELALLESDGSNLDVKLIVESSAGATPPAGADSRLRVIEGEFVTFKITNNSGNDLFVTLLDLESDGSIGVLHPQNRQEPISAGQTKTIRVTASLPKQWTKNSIQDIVKLIATRRKTNFSDLAQPSAPKGVDSLRSRLLDSAKLGSKNAARESLDLDLWVTKTEVFEILRK